METGLIVLVLNQKDATTRLIQNDGDRQPFELEPGEGSKRYLAEGAAP